jgi:hypothetical protein
MDTTAKIIGNPPSIYQTGGLAAPPMMFYDSAADIYYFLDGAQTGYLWSYKYSTNTITFLGNGTAGTASGATPVVYPPTKTVYFFGSVDGSGNQAQTTGTPRVFKMSYASGSNWTTTEITSSTIGCGVLGSAMHPGLSYDSNTQKIYGWPNFGNTVYSFDPTSNTCTAQTFAGGPPDSVDFNGVQYTTGTYGRFQYFPAMDAFALVNSAMNNGYLLRVATVPAQAPVISSFTASSASVTAGSPVTLSWTTSGATAVSISPSVGSVALSGSTTGTPTATTIYTLTATNSSGSVSATVPVTVAAAGPSLPAITSFTAAPNSVAAGQAANLSWAVTGATSIAISPGGFTASAASGTTTVSPTATTIYTLTATNTAGAVAAQATLTVGTSQAPPPADTLTISNSGATVSNYPVQIGRPFVKGEFPNGQLPQAFLGSTPLQTQVDVKSRWPDQSLKHAILSFLIPTFATGQSYTVTLSPGSTVGNTPLAQTQMLAASFSFDAQLQLTSGSTTKTASARTMLANGDYTIWASGPIATTIILANHAQSTSCGGRAASTYDFGFDSYCAFRPEFEATFWPATNQVFVRYIGEIANTEQAEDVTVSNIVLTLGNTSPSTVYTLPASKSPLTMYTLSRWTKTFWLNGTPPAADYNHNLAYLAATNFIANYDTTRVIPATQISNAYATWSALDTSDPYSAADFTKNQSAVGSRHYPADEIGPYTGPAVMWIYTGDHRAQEMATRYAELASVWPVHFREGKAGKFIDRAHTISGVGHWMSVSSRPTYCVVCGSTPFNYGNIAGADKVTPVGTTTFGGWNPEIAHIPDWMPVYLLTGDYYFLEENWAWASWATLATDGSRNDYPGRGPTGVEGHIPGNSIYGAQVRGTAWVLRNRVEVAAISPDSSPEHSYYDLLVNDTLAAFEGERNITTGAYNGTAMWNWGNQFAAANYCTTHSGVGLWCVNAINGVQNGAPTAIHFWVPDGGYPGNNLGGYPQDTSFAGGSTSPWMVQYVIYALGRAKDLGYPSQGLLSWVAPWIISQVTDPTFNPYLVSSYRQATVQPNGQYYTTWAGILSSVCSSAATGCVTGGTSQNAQTAQTWAYPINQYSCALDPNGDGNCSSAFEAGMAIAQVADQPNGPAAWNWIYTNAMTSSALNANPKWAIIPRTGSSVGPPPPPPPPPPVTSANSCDLNSDGVVNGADVTLAINQALGMAPCTTAALQTNGQCNVVDVQRIINASLGQGCRTGN